MVHNAISQCDCDSPMHNKNCTMKSHNKKQNDTALDVVESYTGTASGTTSIATTGRISQDVLARWISYLDASPKTVETYGKAIKQFLKFLQERDITQPTRDTVIQYREHLIATCKASTVQAYIVAVKLFFRWTAQENLYPNISDHVKGAKIDRGHKKDYLTSKQVGDVLHAIDRTTLKGKRDYALLSLMVTTGLRTISVIRANIGDIRTVGDSQALYYQGKGHQEKATYVKIAEPVENAIREYRNARGEKDDDKPLFSSVANRNDGGRMTTRSISRVAKEYLLKVGLNSDRLTAHSFRHTCATLNLLNGGTIEETQQLLDHQNINTTLIYSHALERAKNQSENRVAHAIFG